MQPQHDVDAIEVDPPEILNLRVVEVVTDQTTANRVDNLSDFISDSEIRARVTVPRKQKERAELRAELECLERKKTGGFVSKQNQMGSDEHAHQLSLEHLKHV